MITYCHSLSTIKLTLKLYKEVMENKVKEKIIESHHLNKSSNNFSPLMLCRYLKSQKHKLLVMKWSNHQLNKVLIFSYFRKERISNLINLN